MRYLLLSFTAVSFFLGCSNDTNNQVNGTSSLEKATKNETVSDAGLVKTTNNYFIQESSRPKMMVVGRSFETTPESVKTLITGMNRALIDDINDQKAIIQGAIAIVYQKPPVANETQLIWVGIPLNKALKGWNTLEIPAQNYYKVQTNSPLGETLPFWADVVKDLLEKPKKSSKTWYLEMPSSAVNAEMTAEITNCNLFISK